MREFEVRPLKRRGRPPKKREMLKVRPPVTREELDQATHDFLSQGGKIKRVEPLWLEEGDFFTY